MSDLPMATRMTGDEKRATIAEHFGMFWHPEEQHAVERSVVHQLTGNLRGHSITLHYCKCGASRQENPHVWDIDSDHEVPNYSGSIDAMHRMLEEEDVDVQIKFYETLQKVAEERELFITQLDPRDWAAAFLIVIGKAVL